MNDIMMNEQKLIDYYIRNIKAINGELDELIKTDDVKKYLEVIQDEKVKEYKYLQQKKDFVYATYASNKKQCLKLVESINADMDKLAKFDSLQKYFKIMKSEEVREYKKLQDEKDFMFHSLKIHRDYLEHLKAEEEEKTKSL